MENKYYTPDISEFHIGFEFESNYTLFSKDREWTKHTLDHNDGWFWEEWYVDAVPTEFRVKYLDREDIESLGFEEVPNVPIDWFEKDDWRLYKQGTEVSIKKAGEAFHIHFGIFEGVIKNKSELKKVLKMIGYE